MEFDRARTAVIFLLVVGVGTGGLLAAQVMPSRVVLMMVLPSMLVYGAVALALGVKHGEYRAAR